MQDKTFKQLTGLRGLLIVMVIAHHWLEYSVTTTGSEKTFVHLLSYLGSFRMYAFFVLSGFLITAILIRYRQKAETSEASILVLWRNFFIRRSLRLFPLYFLLLGVVYLFNILWFREVAGWHFGFLSNVLFYIRNDYTLGGHLWSVSAEEQFYIIWPLVMLFSPLKYLRRIIIAGILLAPLFRLGMNVNHPSLFTELLTPAVFDGFALGALLASWYHLPAANFGKEKMIRFTRICGAVGFVVLLLFYFTPFNWALWQPLHPFAEIFYRSANGLLGIWLVHECTLGIKNNWRHFFENKPIVFLGKISYALFLLHNFQLYVFDWFKIPLPTSGFWLLVHFGILVGVATASWYLIELPFNNLKRFFPYIKKRERKAATAATVNLVRGGISNQRVIF